MIEGEMIECSEFLTRLENSIRVTGLCNSLCLSLLTPTSMFINFTIDFTPFRHPFDLNKQFIDFGIDQRSEQRIPS